MKKEMIEWGDFKGVYTDLSMKNRNKNVLFIYIYNLYDISDIKISQNKLEANILEDTQTKVSTTNAIFGMVILT